MQYLEHEILIQNDVDEEITEKNLSDLTSVINAGLYGISSEIPKFISDIISEKSGGRYLGKNQK